MSFFRAKKKAAGATPVTKKKWQMSSSDDDTPQEVACVTCKIGLGDIGLFCLQCKSYYCYAHFTAAHEPDEQKLLTEQMATLLKEQREQWFAADQKVKEVEGEEVQQAESAEQKITALRNECVHPASLQDQVKKSELDTFSASNQNPAAVQDLEAIRSRDKHKRKQIVRMKELTEKHSQSLSKRMAERSQKEEEVRLEAIKAIQASGSVHRYRPLMGSAVEQTTAQDKALTNLSAGWRVNAPSIQLYVLATKEESEDEKEGETNEPDEDSNLDSVVQSAAEQEAAAPHQADRSSDTLNTEKPAQFKVKKVLATFHRDVREHDLEDFFSSCGEMSDIHVKHKGEAIIKFVDGSGAQAALKKSMSKLLGQNVFVALYDPDGLAATAEVVEVGTKYKMCKEFRVKSYCRQGDHCQFAHHVRELVPALAEHEMRHHRARGDMNSQHYQSRSADSYNRRSDDRGSRDGRDRKRKRSRSPSVDAFGREISSKGRSRSRSRRRERERSRSRSGSRNKDSRRHKSRSCSRDKRSQRDRSRSRDRDRQRSKKDDKKEKSKHKDKDKSKDKHKSDHRDKERTRDRDRDRRR